MPLSLDIEPTDTQLFMAMSRLLEAVRVADDADAAIDAALDGLVAELGADRGFLMLSVQGGESVLRARDARGELPLSEHEELSRTIVRRAKTEGRAVYWDGVDDAAGGSLGELGILAAIAVPLRAPAPAPEGVLYVDVREFGKSFGPAHERFVALAATVIAPLLRDASRFEAQRGELVRARSASGGRGLADLVASASMEDVERALQVAAGSRLNMLVLGESGTGKTLLAESFARSMGPVVRATLGSSDDLNTITSELFGHVRGAFSGAVKRRVGLVAHADGGTLVLDEVLNLPPAAQQLLLDLTQFGTYRPLGDDAREPRRADLRIIAVTNGDLDAAMAEGRFRPDLYYRLAGHVITLPPLRARRAELSSIAESVLRGLDPHRHWHLSLGVRRLLASGTHPWPGNVRELEGVLARALARARLDDPAASVVEQRHVAEESALAAVAEPRAATEAPLPTGSLEARWAQLEQSRASLADEERRLLADALVEEGAVASRVARRLGLPRTTLLHRLRLHELTSER